jgi:hypothetical protein
MAVYGISRYGPPTLYGPDRPTTVNPGGPPLPLINSAYLIDPFVAAPVDYQTILLTWTQPDQTTNTPMNEFRLLSNRYGFPVDENDGLIILDETTSPQPPNFIDQNTIPGTMHYYGFFILGEDTAGTPLWIRAGFTACLMPVNDGSGPLFLSLLPEYIQDLNNFELTASNTSQSLVAAPVVPASSFFINSPYPFPVQVTLSGGNVTDVTVDGIDLGVVSQFWVASNGQVTLTYTAPPTWTWANVPAGGLNPYIQSFLNIAGWGQDYLQTQYDFTFQTLNKPMNMPLDQLVQLAGELGMPFTSEMPAFFMRKAVLNWANVMQQRGSLPGITEHIELLSGFGADIQVSRNIMLENDQSAPTDPRFPAFDASTPYHEGERVTFPTYNQWSDSLTYIDGNAVDFNGVYYQFSGTSTTEVPPIINGTLSPGWAVIQGPFNYTCLEAITTLPATAPSGTIDSNATWQFLFDVDDFFPAWVSGTAYTAGTRVSFTSNGLIYDFLCLQANTASTANEPTPGMANAFWEPVFERLMLNQPNLYQGGTVNTWEPVLPASLSTQPVTETLINGIGNANPNNESNDFTHNTFRLYNRSGSVQTQWIRSVIRQTSDFTNTTLNVNGVPDPQLIIENAIPVPSINSTDEWSPDIRYATGSVVSFAGLPYMALRASTGAQPPGVGVPLNQNVTFTTSITPWTAAFGNASSTIGLSTTEGFQGTTSLELIPNGTSTFIGAQSELIDIQPGGSYSASAFALITTTRSLSPGVGLLFFDIGGTEVGSFFSGTQATVGTFTLLTAHGTAPLNAVTARVILQIGGTQPVGDTVFYDLAELTCNATPEWTPLGRNQGIPLMISAQTSQSLSTEAAETFAITPFVEWYDNWGNFISRVFARTPTAGTPGTPTNYVFDGFDTGPGTFIQGRITDAGGEQWDTQTGTFLINGEGEAFPAVAGTQSIATVLAPTSTTQALTFTQPPPSGLDTALVFWWQSETKYWHAGMSGLWFNNGGTFTEAAAYSTACGVNDRVYVVTNNSGATVTMPNGAGTLASPGIAVFRNVISSAGQIAKVSGDPPFGTTIPSAMVPTGSTAQAGIASEAV